MVFPVYRTFRLDCPVENDGPGATHTSSIGHQREYESSVGLRLSKFHGLLHYPRQIRKFGSPLIFGEFLESFLKDFLKRPSKRVNGHTHRLQHDILVQSQESRQFDIARQIIFPSAYACSFTEDDKEMAEIGLPNPPQKTPTDTTAFASRTRNPEDYTWNMDPGDFPPQVLRNTGSPFYRLYILISLQGNHLLTHWLTQQSFAVAGLGVCRPGELLLPRPHHL